MICPYCRYENIEGADECANCRQPLSGLDLPEESRKYPKPAFIQEVLGRMPQRELVTAGLSDPVALAIRGMQTGESGAVLVMDGERLAGIITAWDIVYKVAGQTEDLNAVTCAQIMTPEPIVFNADDSIALAINKMSVGEFRHIPLVRDDGVVNVIDVNDVFRHLSLYMV